MQKEITALGARLVKDYIYFEYRLEHSNDQMFDGLVEKLEEEGRQAKVNAYEESKQTANVFVDGWQSRLNAPGKVVTDLFVVPASVVQATSDALSALSFLVQVGGGSRGNAGNEFQINVEPDSLGAGHKPNST